MSTRRHCKTSHKTRPLRGLDRVHGKLTVNHSTMVTSSADAIRTSSHSIWASWWMCLGSDQSQTTKAWIKLIPLFFFGNRVWQRPLLACFLGISSLKNNSAKFIYWITAGEVTQDGRGRPATVISNVMPAWSVKWDGHTRRLWWVAVDSDHILWNVVLSEDGKSIHLNKYSCVNNIHSNYQHQQQWRCTCGEWVRWGDWRQAVPAIVLHTFFKDDITQIKYYCPSREQNLQ